LVLKISLSDAPAGRRRAPTTDARASRKVAPTGYRDSGELRAIPHRAITQKLVNVDMEEPLDGAQVSVCAADASRRMGRRSSPEPGANVARSGAQTLRCSAPVNAGDGVVHIHRLPRKDIISPLPLVVAFVTGVAVAIAASRLAPQGRARRASSDRLRRAHGVWRAGGADREAARTYLCSGTTIGAPLLSESTGSYAYGEPAPLPATQRG